MEEDCLDDYKNFKDLFKYVKSREPICIHTFSGIKKCCSAKLVDMTNLDWEDDREDDLRQAYLIFTNDNKYITNMEGDIIEFTLNTDYCIIGFYMSWVREIDDMYNTCIIVQDRNKNEYFVYRDHADEQFKCIRFLEDSEYNSDECYDRQGITLKNFRTRKNKCKCEKFRTDIFCLLSQ